MVMYYGWECSLATVALLVGVAILWLTRNSSDADCYPRYGEIFNTIEKVKLLAWFFILFAALIAVALINGWGKPPN